jgi:hypothetical protein
MAAPTMREHRRGLEPKTKRAERAGLKVRKPNLPAESPREQPLVRATGKICSFERRDEMTNGIKNSAEAWKYPQKAMSWYGWGSPVGLGLLIVAIVAFVALLHVAGVIR